MAHKKRGLGRGLQALIPEGQKETPAHRPTDVFFADNSAGADEDGPATEAAPVRREGERSATDIAATLLAPSKRAKRGKKKPVVKDEPAVAAGKEQEPAEAVTSVSEATGVKDSPGHGQAPAPKDESQAPAKRTSGAARHVSRDTSAGPESPSSSDTEAVSAAATTLASSTAPVGAADAASTEAVEPVSRETVGEDEGLVPVPGATFAELPTALIHANPRQPRQVFDEEDITELAASIKEVGLLQPIVVRRVDDPETGEATYELIMGERRLRASREADLETIPAVVRYTEDQDLLRDALLENLHRVQLNPLEEAAAYQQLLDDFNCTHQELSKRIARSRSQISNTLRLMKLPPLVQRRLAAGVLSAGHARALLGLPDAAAMERLAQRIVAEGLSVRATEEIVALHDEPTESRASKVLRPRSVPLPALSTRLSDAFDTRVKVTRGAKKGRITIEFAGDEDLARIVQALAPGTSLAED